MFAIATFALHRIQKAWPWRLRVRADWAMAYAGAGVTNWVLYYTQLTQDIRLNCNIL